MIARENRESRETRFGILAAASQFLPLKGLQDSKISEIAARAGIADSAIYHHFKNKEDLLFSVVGIHLEDVLRNLREQLEGIPEPVSRLSKLIWFHLRYNYDHKDYSRLLLFDCRSNRDFYKHPSYRLIRQYAGVTLSILKDGQAQGVFCKDIDMRNVRNLILGALDWETVRYINSDQGQPCASDTANLMALIKNMIEIRQNVSHTRQASEDKAARVISSAELVFSEKGYTKSTIAEIASRAAVAEGTLYEYFKNKEDLLLSIPKIRFQEHISLLDQIFEVKAPLRKLKRFIRYHYLLYCTNPSFMSVFLLNVYTNPKFYGSEAYGLFKRYNQIVDQILEDGKRDGSIKKDVDNKKFKNLFIGGFCHIALKWIIFGKDVTFDRMNDIDQVVFLLARAVSTP